MKLQLHTASGAIQRRQPLLFMLVFALQITGTAPLWGQDTTDLGTRRLHPTQRPDRSGTQDLAQSGGSWFGTLGIGAALAGFGAYAWFVRKYPAGSRAHQTNSIQILGRQALGARHSIYTVRVGPRTLLIGTGTQGPPTLLTELDDWLDEPSPPTRAEPVKPAVNLRDRVPSNIKIDTLLQPSSTAGGV